MQLVFKRSKKVSQQSDSRKMSSARIVYIDGDVFRAFSMTLASRAGGQAGWQVYKVDDPLTKI